MRDIYLKNPIVINNNNLKKESDNPFIPSVFMSTTTLCGLIVAYHYLHYFNLLPDNSLHVLYCLVSSSPGELWNH